MLFFFLPPLQTATRVTTATASAQVKTAPAVGGWQNGERGWRAKTWRNRRMREAGLNAGNRRTSEEEAQHDHDCSG